MVFPFLYDFPWVNPIVSARPGAVRSGSAGELQGTDGIGKGGNLVETQWKPEDFHDFHGIWS